MIEGLMSALRRLLSVRYPYSDPAMMRRARILLAVNWMILFADLITAALIAVWAEGDVAVVTILALTACSILTGLTISNFSVQRGRLRQASVFTVATMYLALTIFVVWMGADRVSLMTYLTLVVMSSALLSVQGLFISTLASALSIVALHQLRQASVLAQLDVPIDPAMLSVLTLSVTAFMLWYFSADREIALRETMETTRRLSATSLVSQVAAATLELDTMLDRVVDQVRTLFNLYYVQVFLIDPQGQYAVFEAGTGEAGQRLLDRHYRLEVGSRSAIGQAAATGKPILALDSDAASLHRRSEFLAKTRSELALPLLLGERVIGVLDVQSTRRDAFSDEDVQAMQVMANQLAVTIENARLFAEQHQRAEEAQALLQQAQARLAEAERLNRRLTRASWDEYLAARGQDVIGVTLERGQTRPDTAWTPGLTLAARESRPVMSQEGDRRLIAVPVGLGGEVIGALELELDPNIPPDDALEVSQAVASRLALTAQNARLVEQSHQQAQREYQLSQVAGALQAQASVDDLLSVVVSELGRVLGAEQASICLGLRQTETTFVGGDHGNGNGRRRD